MGRRMDHLRADAIADGEASRARGLALGRSAPVQHGRRRRQPSASLPPAWPDATAFRPRSRPVAIRPRSSISLLEARQPDLVITLAEIVLGRHDSRGRSATCRCSSRRAAPIASVIANARRSHSAVKHRLVRLGPHRTGPRHAAHIVCAVHQAHLVRLLRQSRADHAVAGDEFRKAFLAPAFGAGGAHRHHEITNFRGRIPDPDFGARLAVRSRNP